MNLLKAFLPLFCASLLAASTPQPAAPDPMEKVLARLYNFDFSSAHKILDGHLQEHPTDAVGHAMRAATHVFYELDRLKILESEFFESDKRIADKKKLKPDPAVRAGLMQAIAQAEKLANEALASDPRDTRSLFALCLAAGLQSDYVALVEKKQFGSLSYTKKAQTAALRLLRVDPNFHDAHLTSGINEYLLASLPFFVRWFVRFEEVEGDKQEAIRKLRIVAAQGRYLGPFARILLSIIYLREKKPEETEKLLTGLARDYPENPLIRKELAKVRSKLHEAAAGGSK